MGKVDTSKVKKAFRKLERDPVLAEIAVAVYRKPLSDGLAGTLSEGRGWPENSRLWSERKRVKGWGKSPWIRTGKTLKAIKDNAPKKLGTKKGMKVGMNWRSAVAFAVPRAFTDSKGKRLPANRQDLVYSTLKRGSALTKLRANAEKRGRSLAEVLSSVVGPGRRAQVIPARPLFVWRREWYPEMEKDIDEAIKRAFAREGFEVR